jgi:hypothetical protein
MRDNPYSPSHGSDGKPFVRGPGNGMDYYSGMLFPEMRLSSLADAEAAAKCCNEAYRQGYQQAQRDIRAALGAT